MVVKVVIICVERNEIYLWRTYVHNFRVGHLSTSEDETYKMSKMILVVQEEM